MRYLKTFEEVYFNGTEDGEWFIWAKNPVYK